MKSEDWDDRVTQWRAHVVTHDIREKVVRQLPELREKLISAARVSSDPDVVRAVGRVIAAENIAKVLAGEVPNV